MNPSLIPLPPRLTPLRAAVREHPAFDADPWQPASRGTVHGVMFLMTTQYTDENGSFLDSDDVEEGIDTPHGTVEIMIARGAWFDYARILADQADAFAAAILPLLGEVA